MKTKTNFKIIKATKENLSKANDYLTKLIIDEKKYDDNINETCVIKNLYEKLINDNSCIFYVLNNNEIIGYIYGYVQNNGNAYINKIVQLDAMYVDDKYRNNGLGQMLINEFKKWSQSKGVSIIELKVCSKNTAAYNLYEKNGFIEQKKIMNIYIGGE